MMPNNSRKSCSVLPAGHVQAIHFQPVSQLIRKLGGNPESVFRVLNLSEALLQDSAAVLPLSLAGELLAHSARETGCEHFGLLLGSVGGLNQLGLIANLMAKQPTIGDALATLVKFHHITNRTGLALIRQHKEDAYLEFCSMESNFSGFRHFHEGVMAIALNIMRSLSHAEWTPTAVYFSHRPPKNPQTYARFFGAPCYFNTAHAELQFPAALLQAPNATLGASSVTSVEMNTLNMSALDWLERARRAAYSLVALGDCNQPRFASALGISVRTMNRRLEQCGVSYFDILDNARYVVSCKLIRETDMPLKDIAAALSYTDASSSTRAFRRWSGVTPEQWRKARCL